MKPGSIDIGACHWTSGFRGDKFRFGPLRGTAIRIRLTEARGREDAALFEIRYHAS